MNRELTKQQKVFINKSKIHFESKSQLFRYTVKQNQWCLSISQRYILKANHNRKGNSYFRITGVYQ